MAINTGSVIKGGLVAGLVINISETILNVLVVEERMIAELAARNLPDIGNAAIGIFVAMCFALGVITVWLYAAIRPRFGAGPGTAVCAGLLVWGLAFLWPAIGLGVMGFHSWSLLGIVVVWQLAEMVLSSVVGAYLYKE